MPTSEATSSRDDHLSALEAVVGVAQEMHRVGLVVGTAGNVSARLHDGTFALTASSVPYPSMSPDDIVRVDAAGEMVDGRGSPSSEKSLHLACYARHPEVGGVVHCHPAYASMFAIAHTAIPAVIEEVIVYIGGEVAVCDYRRTGSEELADVVSDALGDRSATLMANHGLVCVGRDPGDALHAAEVVERTAKIVWGATALGGAKEFDEGVVSDFAGVYAFIRSEMWGAAQAG